MQNIKLAQSSLNRRRQMFERSLAAQRVRAVEDAKFRARQAHGKVRRFVQINFRKEEVAADLELRRGECNRCGACCEILFKCPFLKKYEDGTSTCGIYEDRPNQCRLFPINKRDLTEVRGSCSYYFIEKTGVKGQKSEARIKTSGFHSDF